jgi:transcriptional regulator with XRE-family HTH domain
MEIEIVIKHMAKVRDISMRQLCKGIGMTENGLSYSLRKNTIKINTIEKIAQYFNVNPIIIYRRLYLDSDYVLIDKSGFEKLKELINKFN